MDVGISGIIIAIIIGAAQVISSREVYKSTKISNDNQRLKDDIDQLKIEREKRERKIERYAKQILFLRFVEESVCSELARTNTDYKLLEVKRRIHRDVEEIIEVSYENYDSEIKHDSGKNLIIEPVDILGNLNK